MEIIDLLRQQFKECNESLDATMQGVTPDQAQWQPAGTANALGATYAHILMTQDRVANVAIKGGAPLASTTWARRVGISESPPTEDVPAWAQWARLVKVDLDALKAYGHAVQASVDQVLMSLTETDLSRSVRTPFGTSTVQFLITAVLIGHTHSHHGEISCLKGLQGARGYVI